MRALVHAWSEVQSIGQHAVGQLPWRQVTVLLDTFEDREACDWYAKHAAKAARATLPHPCGHAGDYRAVFAVFGDGLAQLRGLLWRGEHGEES
jgi:hypothetical protein